MTKNLTTFTFEDKPEELLTIVQSRCREELKRISKDKLHYSPASQQRVDNFGLIIEDKNIIKYKVFIDLMKSNNDGYLGETMRSEEYNPGIFEIHDTWFKCSGYIIPFNKIITDVEEVECYALSAILSRSSIIMDELGIECKWCFYGKIT